MKSNISLGLLSLIAMDFAGVARAGSSTRTLLNASADASSSSCFYTAATPSTGDSACTWMIAGDAACETDCPSTCRISSALILSAEPASRMTAERGPTWAAPSA